jgi:hypothetical protein
MSAAKKTPWSGRPRESKDKEDAGCRKGLTDKRNMRDRLQVKTS